MESHNCQDKEVENVKTVSGPLNAESCGEIGTEEVKEGARSSKAAFVVGWNGALICMLRVADETFL